MKHKFAAFVVAAVLLTAGILTGHGRQQQPSAADQEKIEALNEAYRSGLLTREEYEAKLQQLNSGGGAPYVNGATGTKVVSIFDPLIGLDYVRIAFPSNWLFQGGLVQGSSCSSVVSMFYRANSPDGLAGSKVLPRFDWAWSSNAPYSPGPNSDCMTYEGEIPAADFLKYMINLLHVEYVKNLMTEAELENARRPVGNPRTNSSDAARVLTRFRINNLEEEEVVDVQTICNYLAYLPPMRNVANHICSAYVYLTWAPAGRTEATWRMLQSVAAWKFNPAWFQRKAQLNAQQTAMLVGQIVANGQAFRRAMDLRFQQHQEFMATMQRGFDMSNRRAMESMNAQSRMADDWCDYALGVQKRYDPNTGQLYKTDSGFSYDWVNEDGKTHYVTNDINDNPNGRGRGYWTLTTNVH